MEKQVDIGKIYDEEIAEINYILQGLHNGRVYGFNGNNAKMDGTLQSNINKLTNKLNELMYKIEYGKASISEEVAEQLFIVSEDKK